MRGLSKATAGVFLTCLSTPLFLFLLTFFLLPPLPTVLSLLIWESHLASTESYLSLTHITRESRAPCSCLLAALKDGGPAEKRVCSQHQVQEPDQLFLQWSPLALLPGVLFGNTNYMGRTDSDCLPIKC